MPLLLQLLVCLFIINSLKDLSLKSEHGKHSALNLILRNSALRLFGSTGVLREHYLRLIYRTFSNKGKNNKKSVENHHPNNARDTKL